MSKSKRLLTVQDASSLIAELSLILRREIDSKNPDVLPAVRKASHNGGNENGAAYLLILMDFNSSIRYIVDKGCLLKDIDLALINFPAIRHGREIYL